MRLRSLCGVAGSFQSLGKSVARERIFRDVTPRHQRLRAEEEEALCDPEGRHLLIQADSPFAGLQGHP